MLFRSFRDDENGVVRCEDGSFEDSVAGEPRHRMKAASNIHWLATSISSRYSKAGSAGTSWTCQLLKSIQTRGIFVGWKDLMGGFLAHDSASTL